MTVVVPISWGELLDKITILEIKAERIVDENKQTSVVSELTVLRSARDQAGKSLDEVAETILRLKAVNERLWDIENDIRACEAAGDFSEKFIALARAVYQTNDRRAALKRDMNLMLGSDLIEEKEYYKK
ncbi:DUF6165 family protein [Inquilinus sp. CAU 1745]|uniref:DUF6165 family protein n=1 Tax=Inquilinus sp. CAU 1745 TaxID=3140369 RepID=UPI00325B4A15